MYVLNLLAGIVARAAKLDMPSFPIRIIVNTKMLDIVVKFGKLCVLLKVFNFMNITLNYASTYMPHLSPVASVSY